MTAPREPQSFLRVPGLEIVDSHGRPRITLSVTTDPDGVEDPYIELFDTTGSSRLTMAVDSNASDDGGLVYLSFDRHDTPRLVLHLSDNEVSIKEVEQETVSEARSVRWQRIPDREREGVTVK